MVLCSLCYSKDSEDFNSISCTDTVQSWGGFAKRALSAYKPCLLGDMPCHVKPHKERYKAPPKPEELSDIVKKDVISDLQASKKM